MQAKRRNGPVAREVAVAAPTRARACITGMAASVICADGVNVPSSPPPACSQASARCITRVCGSVTCRLCSCLLGAQNIAMWHPSKSLATHVALICAKASIRTLSLAAAFASPRAARLPFALAHAAGEHQCDDVRLCSRPGRRDACPCALSDCAHRALRSMLLNVSTLQFLSMCSPAY